MAITNLKNYSQTKTSKTAKIQSWMESYMNPLAGMTKRSIENMLYMKRYGNDVQLQIAYSEIEANMPIFGVVIDKRTAGVTGRTWDIMPNDDSDEAKAQAAQFKKVFDDAEARNKDGLTAALEHLVLGAFRGRSAVKAFYDNGILKFKLLDNWNVLEWNGNLYFNPECDMEALPKDGALKQIPEGEVTYVTYQRPIDQPGIMVYLRQLVGEEQWARFVEKQGIPQVILTPPEGTSESQQDEWMYRAERIFEGGSGVIPPGGKVDELTAARGQDPFSAYVQHQMEVISILATGGTLLTLSGSTGLGSNLADVQLQQFNNLVNRDCKLIQNAINGSVMRMLAEKLGGGKLLCTFRFVEKDETTALEYLEYAKAARDLGLALDVEKLKKLTGLSFIVGAEENGGEEVWHPEQNNETTTNTGIENN